MIEDVKADFQKYVDLFRPAPPDHPANAVRVLLASRGFFVVGGYRLRFWVRDVCERSGSSLLKCLLKALNHVVNAYSLFVMKTWIMGWPIVGPGLYLSNKGAIIIGATRIGAGCVIQDTVTIGMNRKGVRPEIGDNVWIGPDTVVYGPKIGNGVLIEGGTVLSKSVPDRCIVAGKPGRIKRRDVDDVRSSLDPTLRSEGED